jgi:hypothetical protein
MKVADVPGNHSFALSGLNQRSTPGLRPGNSLAPLRGFGLTILSRRYLVRGLLTHYFR